MTTYNERNRIKAAERKRDKELKAAEKQRLKDEEQRLDMEREQHRHLGWRDVFGHEVRMDSMGLYLWNREMSQIAGQAQDDITGDTFLAMLVMAVNGYSIPPQDWDKKTDKYADKHQDSPRYDPDGTCREGRPEAVGIIQAGKRENPAEYNDSACRSQSARYACYTGGRQ